MFRNMKRAGYARSVLKGQDIVVLLTLALRDREANWIEPDVRSLATAIGYDLAGTHRAMQRLEEARLYQRKSQRVPRAACVEFLLHGVPYVFPAHLGPETRGIRTAWGAEPLSAEFPRANALPPVWPDPYGDARGFALEPIHHLAITASGRHPQLHAQLALLDARRAGDARVRSRAAELLEASLSR